MENGWTLVCGEVYVYIHIHRCTTNMRGTYRAWSDAKMWKIGWAYLHLEVEGRGGHEVEAERGEAGQEAMSEAQGQVEDDEKEGEVEEEGEQDLAGMLGEGAGGEELGDVLARRLVLPRHQKGGGVRKVVAGAWEVVGGGW